MLGVEYEKTKLLPNKQLKHTTTKRVN